MTANITLQRSAYPGITSDNFGGTAFTGSDKATGREVYVGDSARIVTIDRRILIPGIDFTESGGTVTINIALDNRHRITIYR
jgi:hypothetical protein